MNKFTFENKIKLVLILVALIGIIFNVTACVAVNDVKAETIKSIDNGTKKDLEPKKNEKTDDNTVDDTGEEIVEAAEPVVEDTMFQPQPVQEVIQPIQETPVIQPVPTNVPIEQLIIDACNRYGIRSDIPLAIARLETGHFSSYAYVYQNNPGGMMYGGSTMSFESKESGVEAFISNLANNYFGIGLNSVESIGAKYCPGSQHWIDLVYQLMY